MEGSKSLLCVPPSQHSVGHWGGARHSAPRPPRGRGFPARECSMTWEIILEPVSRAVVAVEERQHKEGDSASKHTTGRRGRRAGWLAWGVTVVTLLPEAPGAWRGPSWLTLQNDRCPLTRRSGNTEGAPALPYGRTQLPFLPQFPPARWAVLSPCARDAGLVAGLGAGVFLGPPLLFDSRAMPCRTVWARRVRVAPAPGGKQASVRGGVMLSMEARSSSGPACRPSGHQSWHSHLWGDLGESQTLPEPQFLHL